MNGSRRTQYDDFGIREHPVQGDSRKWPYYEQNSKIKSQKWAGLTQIEIDSNLPEIVWLVAGGPSTTILASVNTLYTVYRAIAENGHIMGKIPK